MTRVIGLALFCLLLLGLCAAVASAQDETGEAAEDTAGEAAAPEDKARAAERRYIQDAQLKAQVEEYDAAIAILDRGHAALPGSGSILYWRGRVRQDRDDHAGALADFDKALRADPKTENQVLASVAHSLRSLGRYDAALERCEALVAKEEDKKPGAGRWSRASLRELTGDYEGAVADYDVIVNAQPKNASALGRRGGAKVAAGDAAGAVADFDKALELSKRSPWLLAGRARALLEAGRIEEAAKAYDDVLQTAPWSARGPSARGRFRLIRGEFAEGKSDFLHACDLDPADDYDRLFLNLAYRLMGAAEIGSKRLSKYVAKRRRTKTGDWFDVVAGFLLGEIDEAALLDAASKGETPWRTKERRCEAWWYAGAVRLARGDEKGAREHFEACVEADIRGFIEYEAAKGTLARLSNEGE